MQCMRLNCVGDTVPEARTKVASNFRRLPAIHVYIIDYCSLLASLSNNVFVCVHAKYFPAHYYGA